MYRERAAQYLLEGNRKAAHECFERCVEVTSEMARCVIKAGVILIFIFGFECISRPPGILVSIALSHRTSQTLS